LRVICDVEANGLVPTKIHLIICKDIDNDTVRTFKGSNLGQFVPFVHDVDLWVGHNFLGYDLPALNRLMGVDIPVSRCVDTLVLSRLFEGLLTGKKPHSIEAWGSRLGKQKAGADIKDWSVLTPEMEERCVSDVEINYLLFKKWERFLSSERWKSAIETEHFIAYLCRSELHENGFAFDYDGAVALKTIIDKELVILDDALRQAWPARSVLVRECCPKATKFGTINRSSVPRGTDDLTAFTVGAPFSVIEFVSFNPASSTQRIERLNEAGWRPTEKTKGHKEAEKELREIQRRKKKTATDVASISELNSRLQKYQTFGWAVNEENLKTLPDTAPAAAHTLVRRLLLGNRSSTLHSWITACHEDGRIHGSFAGIGAWTQRMSHSNPNQGNIPKFDSKQPAKTPYSDKMRSLWKSGPNRLLVGVDAESIQLRIFGHYINDKEFISALLEGRKEDGTDPHSVNWRALGSPCKSRDDAKTFIYAFLLGAGLEKVASILGCSKEEAAVAIENFVARYPGLAYLKEEVIPYDAARGYFEGFDGRLVRIFGDDVDSRRHFTLAGYLQNGEAVIMKRAVQIWYPKLKAEKVPFWWVNFVHDEYQTETVEDYEIAKYVATTQADAIRQVGSDLGLNCPMAGSVLSDHGTLIDGRKWAIGKDWMVTH
jgi:DNA polymerase-1